MQRLWAPLSARWRASPGAYVGGMGFVIAGGDGILGHAAWVLLGLPLAGR